MMKSAVLISLMQSNANQNSAVVKVDIQGYEHKIVEMLAAVIAKHPNLRSIIEKAVIEARTISVSSYNLKPGDN